MKFIDRTFELEFLEEKYSSNHAEFVILYGRRRIGKTELIHQFIKDKELTLYYLSRLEAKIDAINRFNYALARTFNDVEIAQHPLHTWDEIFSYLGKKANKRIIVVIDEFPFMVERSPEIPSVLQEHWDSTLRHTKIMLILLGSSVSMMEKHALDYKSPLYGRRTGQWQLTKLNPIYLRDFFPNYDIKEIITVYSCLDTIPGYLHKFDPHKTVWDNIHDKILMKGEYLYEEPLILLREELRDPSNYMSILKGIAGGLTTFNEIYQRTQLDKSLVSKYLHILERLGYVTRIFPVTESYKKRLKGKGRYKIADNFIDFWFQFVYLNQDLLEIHRVDSVMNLVTRRIEDYIGPKFENFIMDVFPHLNLFSYTTIGKWWHKNIEIDIVALNSRNNKIFFGECKWKDNVAAPKIISQLAEKAQHVQWKRREKRTEVYAIFARSFSKTLTEYENKKVYCIDFNALKRVFFEKSDLSF